MEILLVILTISIIVALVNVSTLWKEIWRIKMYLKHLGEACEKFSENENEIAKHIRSIENVFNMAIKEARERREREANEEKEQANEGN